MIRTSNIFGPYIFFIIAYTDFLMIFLLKYKQSTISSVNRFSFSKSIDRLFKLEINIHLASINKIKICQITREGRFNLAICTYIVSII